MNNDHISNIFEAKKKIVELERQKAELDKPKPKNALAWLFVALLAIITTGPAVALFYIAPHVDTGQAIWLGLIVAYTTFVAAMATRDCYKIATNKD